VFDVQAEYAFGRFPVELATFDAHGNVYECSLDGRKLLAGRTLLDPRDDYPLGRIDWFGADTTSDLELVERMIVEELRAHWPKLAGVRACAGRVEWNDDGPEMSGLVSLDEAPREA
jgi:hypothetical protein